MPYTPAAEALKRCKALRADGEGCGNWAVWADQDGRCASHGGRGTNRSERREYPAYRTSYIACTCVAYAWPHRRRRHLPLARPALVALHDPGGETPFAADPGLSRPRTSRNLTQPPPPSPRIAPIAAAPSQRELRTQLRTDPGGA